MAAARGQPSELRAGVKVWPGSGTTLVDLAIATEIKGRKPVNVSDRYAEMPDMFLCFNALKNSVEDAQVTHIWRRGDRIISRVELSVGRSPHWRTWSRQRVKPTWTGEWSCEVVGPDGRRLGLASFRAGSG